MAAAIANTGLLLSILRGVNDSAQVDNSIRLASSIAYVSMEALPDLAYFFRGYNSLKGYPLEVGHDPGFTKPIFAADYSRELTTDDTRYKIPRGVTMVPDVSCITSFSSRLVDSMSALSSSLSLSADITASGWGVSFSASYGYKMARSEISTNKFKYIISTAQCEYYYMQLLEKDPPPFHPYFIAWVKKLNNTDSEDGYMSFIDTFGTHYPTEMDFGASFTFEYKMSSLAYESQSEKALSASAAFSASAFGYKASGGVEMSSELKQAMSQFQESVTTRSITVGAAPPPDGDAMTWASSVQENPVPVKYKLNSIEDLFTADFMARGIDAQGTAVNYARIQGNIVRIKSKYCNFLMARGLVDDCSSVAQPLMMQATRFGGTPYTDSSSSIGNCMQLCFKRTTCVAADFCTNCAISDPNQGKCRMYSAYDVTSATDDKNWEAVIRLDNLKSLLQIKDTAVSGLERSYANIESVSTPRQCLDQCVHDMHCVAFTYNPSPDIQKCTLYANRYISLVVKSGSSAYFLSPTARDVVKTGGAPKFFLVGSEWVGPECTSQTYCDALYATCSRGVCKCEKTGNTTTDQQTCLATSCAELRKNTNQDGVYTISVNGQIMEVYCDQTTDGGGWTVIQRRMDGSEDFYRNWADYQNGFGDVTGEFWFGLERMHQLTSTGTHKLRIDMEGFDGIKKYAQYTFSVGPASDKYRLHISDYNGTAGDSMLPGQNNAQFTTKDKDNDKYTGNCAVTKESGWWFTACGPLNLNGRYVVGGSGQLHVFYWAFANSTVSLKKTEMKIRPA